MNSRLSSSIAESIRKLETPPHMRTLYLCQLDPMHAMPVKAIAVVTAPTAEDCVHAAANEYDMTAHSLHDGCPPELATPQELNFIRTAYVAEYITYDGPITLRSFANDPEELIQAAMRIPSIWHHAAYIQVVRQNYLNGILRCRDLIGVVNQDDQPPPCLRTWHAATKCRTTEQRLISAHMTRTQARHHIDRLYTPAEQQRLSIDTIRYPLLGEKA